MSSTAAIADEAALSGAPANFRLALSHLRRNWKFGGLKFDLPAGGAVRVEGDSQGPFGRLIVRDYRFVSRVMASADIGLGEGYMAGEWDSPDLPRLLEALTLNFDRLGPLTRGGPLSRFANRLAHAINGNSRRGSRRNIHAHYDLGNAFYELWLDPGMTCSSAGFEQPHQPLDEAHRHKYEALAREIELRPAEHVLEIGCGWGGFAEYAAGEVGAKVTALTISPAQHEFARRRMFEQGLAERVDVRLLDYRDVDGEFDRIVAIEMFEAVGEAYWKGFFGKLRAMLAPGGRAGLQIITIRDDLFPAYRRQSDFLRRYVFPGGMLPSEARLRQETARVGLEWRSLARFGRSYAETLAQWATSFDQARAEIVALGFDNRFLRLWRFYLAYCEAGFRTGRTDVIQVALT